MFSFKTQFKFVLKRKLNPVLNPVAYLFIFLICGIKIIRQRMCTTRTRKCPDDIFHKEPV